MNKSNNHGKNALIIAVEADSMRSVALDPDINILKCVQLLLKAGPNVNIGSMPYYLFTFPSIENPG